MTGPVAIATPDVAIAPIRRFARLSLRGSVGLAVTLVIGILAIFGPHLAPYDQADILSFSGGFTPPDSESWLGTDHLGRDLLSRLLWGARVTLGVSLLGTLAAYLIGIPLGVAAAVAGGWTDIALSRINDAVLSLPKMMLGMLAVAALGSSLTLLVIVSGIAFATGVFRIARSLAQDIVTQDFVEVARARGEGTWWIMTREILPNVRMPLLTDFGIRFVYVILFLSSLSFLGLGIQPPAADWGSMVKDNLLGLPQGSIAPLIPAFAIALVTVSVNLIVDDVSARSGGSLTDKML